MEREMEKERAARREKRQPPPPSGRPPPPTAGQTPAEALLRRIEEEVEAIRKVASSSKHLKGTFVRILKEASASIMEAVESITSRTSSREVRILQDENNRLRVELQIIKSEMGDIRREMAEGRCVVAAQGAAPPTPAVKRPSRAGRDPPTVTGEVAEVRTLQEVEARLIRQVGDIIDARLAAFTDRLAPERPFRPPLASAAGGAGVSAARPVPTKRTTVKRKTGETSAMSGGGSALRGVPSAGSGGDPLPFVDVLPQGESWATVVRKGKRKTSAKTGPPVAAAALAPAPNGRPAKARKPPAAGPGSGGGGLAQLRRGARKRRRIRRPRSAAIVLTLPSDASEKGLTYFQVLNELTEKISLGDHGIPGVTMRKSQTGGRIIEVRGPEMTAKADSLAAGIRMALAGKGLKITRPERTAELRLLGLGETVTLPDVGDAIRRETDCTGDIRLGPIRMSPMGLGSMWVSCPVVAANKLAAKGRLLVGWTSARVQLLTPRPLQCFRCLERGHTAARCDTKEDRSGLCYRCGQPGHLAAVCRAQPSCPICKERGRSSSHRCGGPACRAPHRRIKKAAPTDEHQEVQEGEGGCNTAAASGDLMETGP